MDESSESFQPGQEESMQLQPPDSAPGCDWSQLPADLLVRIFVALMSWIGSVSVPFASSYIVSCCLICLSATTLLLDPHMDGLSLPMNCHGSSSST
jgi:hypothetical protein